MSLNFYLAQDPNAQPKSGGDTTVTTGTQSQGAPQGPPPSGGGLLPMLLPFALFIPILFLMFRRQKKESEARKSLKKGDRVVSTSGLIGELMDLDERVAKVKIAPGTTVQMLASSVSPLPEAQPVADKELKDAKAVSDKK